MQDNLKHIRQLPNGMLASLSRLIVNRTGNHKESFMITRDIIDGIKPKQTYQFIDHPVPKLIATTVKEPVPNYVADIRLPKHAVFRGDWYDTATSIGTDANILGGVGTLMIQGEEIISVPVVPANHADLAFYHARLLTAGSVITFETQEILPLTEVSVGQHYVEHYLAHTDLGGGEYIEYHDQPHFWAPQNAQAGGHILLGRQEGAYFYFTAFYIPLGSAVYVSPYTLHSDAYLIGDYLVVYALSEHFSTVLLRDKHKNVQRLQFVETC